MDELKLYYSPSCYYSLKVLSYIKMNDISLELCSTREPENREYLISQGGKNQVPCLFIGGKALYESDDIIEYLRDRFNRG